MSNAGSEQLDTVALGTGSAALQMAIATRGG
ncbi:hypothetical protein SBI_07460 [Streptomyces bingchenggensis BCW-1]|uniref:Uncharacterized protein n=1 Tax=Streptomyces bingchenggensis (strain BCW-1) TaxID=749414 RepID=D7C962_STRBB|nr:hypothetical protein SBI_07460 [Streptomyces bingchenggensis BCW-1]